MPANIYTLSNTDEEHSGYNYQVPSLEYLVEYLNNIENILQQHIKDTKVHTTAGEFNGIPEVQSSNEEFPVEKQDSIRADQVIPDNRHQFITKTELDEFRNKPTMADIDAGFEGVTNNLKSYFNDLYIQLLNMPDAVNTLKNISDMLKSDEGLEATIKTRNVSVDNTALEEHITNGCHLTGEDRKVINNIESMLSDGIDWNANTDDIIYIKNKPESMPADGGNADTVGGIDPSKLINHKTYDVYLGIEGNDYTNDTVDEFYRKVEKCFIPTGVDTSYYFRKGTYSVDSLIINNNVTINGCGDLTNFVCDETSSPINILDNCMISNVKFTNAVIKVGNGCILNNVTFENCDITLNRTKGTTIEGCNIIGANTKYKYVGSCLDNFIIHNRVTKKCNKLIVYRGGNNIITDNIFI